MISKKIRRTKLCVLISIAVPSYLTQSANYSDSDVNMFYAICIPRKKLPVGSFFLGKDIVFLIDSFFLIC